MTLFEIANEPAFGFGVVQVPGDVDPGTQAAPDFPPIDIGSDSTQWGILLASLFSGWAYFFEGSTVVVRVGDDGIARAWLQNRPAEFRSRRPQLRVVRGSTPAPSQSMPASVAR